jgi:quinolinate synthase
VDILNYTETIKQLKIEKDAVILAHYYQRPEIQDIADYVGDSFALSKLAKNLPNKVIVFCGVHFMAESAKILSPEKTILLPALDAGCPMADMVTAEDIIELRNKYPEAAIVCYVNSSAEVKAQCDICCTSSNAVRIVKTLPQKDIVFVPDQNLGHFVAQQVPEKNVILFNGYCITHHKITLKNVEDAKRAIPDALFAVHPECTPEIVEKSDFAGSTAEIIDYVTNTDCEKFIIGTEMGVMHEIQKRNPNKKLYILNSGLVCPNMKKTTMEDVYDALTNTKAHEINLDTDIIEKAKHSLDRMLTI